MVNSLLTTEMRQFETATPLGCLSEKPKEELVRVSHHVHVADREALLEATELIARYGEYASSEAAIRADRSRSLGNILHFCRWRQIERTIEMLSAAEPMGSIH